MGIALAGAGCGGSGETTTKAAGNTARGGTGGAPSGGVALERLGRFDAPVYVTQPPGDDHLFVVEKTGRVVRIQPDGRDPKVFLDLSDQVSTGGEQGLLSIAFSPDYQMTGLFYVDYTDSDGNTQVVEYEAPPGKLAEPASARPVLTVDQPYDNHNGGQLEFGPDGLLYIGLGDGGSEDDPQRNGQDLSTLLSKILRIDPRPTGAKPYAVPADNPFASQTDARAETYSYGLRNPWRFSFDSKTGALWIGDVGQNELEEIDGVPEGAGAGANFGWSAYEGTDRFNDDQTADHAVAPVLEYSHDHGCSVTGGYVSRDRALPALYGRYVYGDFCQGELRSFKADPGQRARDDASLGLNVASLSSFGQDQAGHLYATSLDGSVYRLVGKK